VDGLSANLSRVGRRAEQRPERAGQEGRGARAGVPVRGGLSPGPSRSTGRRIRKHVEPSAKNGATRRGRVKLPTVAGCSPADLEHDRGLDVPLHVDGASGGFFWRFVYPDSAWNFRLEQIRSINVSGHKFGLVYPGIGWLVFRERSDLAEDLVSYENYLGKTDATFTLNFSTGSSMVLAQYYNFIRFGHDGYTYVVETIHQKARMLAGEMAVHGQFRLIGADEEQLLCSPSAWPRSIPMTSSTSRLRSPPSVAGWSRRTRWRRGRTA
jgi:hypothetical protein